METNCKNNRMDKSEDKGSYPTMTLVHFFLNINGSVHRSVIQYK